MARKISSHMRKAGLGKAAKKYKSNISAGPVSGSKFLPDSGTGQGVLLYTLERKPKKWNRKKLAWV